MSRHPAHPGTFVREHVIPVGMSVTEAAGRLGVGRPALSNMLNGNSSLSPKMAGRLEKVFGADRQELLDRQTAFDRHARAAAENAVAVHPYVPGFLTIKAGQLHNWSCGNSESRELLPVLVRMLVHSTGRDLCRVDFHGYDNAARRGWDGYVEAGAPTPWIPEGKSCWELGTGQNPGRKAECDYSKRLASVPPNERSECTYVFVTPRNWTGKTEWADSKRDGWKEVRALDASDLEQWLEGSIAPRMWLAEKLGIPTEGFETLDSCWRRWAEATQPEMKPEIFKSSVDAHRKEFENWLAKPSERPFVVTADSRDEALAFLHCLFRKIGEPWADLAAVFRSTETLRRLAESSASFIPVVPTEEAERELAGFRSSRRCIAVRLCGTFELQPDIALEILDDGAFRRALAAMDIEEDEIDRLARKSARSPTILRRRLSQIPAIRNPQWAESEETARKLIPIALLGAWDAKSDADQKIIVRLAAELPQEIERNVTGLLDIEDSPVWSVGNYRGAAAKIDALFAIHRHVIEQDITKFMELAEHVLSEGDPALELPENERWAAAMHGKVRTHSAALRDGICETLVILSVYGNKLFRRRLGIDLATEISELIRRLLSPLDLDLLRSHDREIPLYAEAAPEVFLEIVEEDLRQSEPVVFGLLQSAGSGPLGGGCPRSGFLWALECLAWKYVTRVSLILAKLSRTVIDDNWLNKPVASLQAIFRPRFPRTAAPLPDRKQALETLTQKFPDVGWQICIKQLDSDPAVFPSYRPRWRRDAFSAESPVTAQEEIDEFRRYAIDIAFAWSNHDRRTLGNLVERLHEMDDKDQTKVWDRVDEWADTATDDEAKADLRRRIHRTALARRAGRGDLNVASRDRARAAYEKLRPGDLVIGHAWLFANHWIRRPEFEEEPLDITQHNERVRSLRVSAVREIWKDQGFEGVMALVSGSGAPDVVGHSLEQVINDGEEQACFLRRCLRAESPANKVDGCIKGFLSAIGDDACGAVLCAAADGAEVDDIVRFFRGAPFGWCTWRLLDRYDEVVGNQYWQTVRPSWNRYGEDELLELIDRLLEAKRPRAAFAAADFDWSQVETSRLKRLLFECVTVDTETNDDHGPEADSLFDALNELGGRSGVTIEEMAQLELLYIGALEYSERGIPNLERWIFEVPILFVQALALRYKREDDGEDPLEWRIHDPGRRQALASASYKFLRQIRRVPGTGEDNKIKVEKLSGWIAEVRKLCAEYGRSEIGDRYIGRILSRGPNEEHGAWPCPSICKAMERFPSKNIGQGFQFGVLDRRGATVRMIGEGGKKERALATKYRSRAENLADYPYVSSVLEGIAKCYDQDAEWRDNRVKIDQRLERR